MTQNLSRQQEAWNYINDTFVKLMQGDKRVSYEIKRSVEAFWADLFAQEVVRENMIQAINNFLWEIDKRLDASRKAGIQSAIDVIERLANLNGRPSPIKDTGATVITETEIDTLMVLLNLKELLEAEDSPEEVIEVNATDDLSEVGGGDEDDSPIL